jgi:hypothetical protein
MSSDDKKDVRKLIIKAGLIILDNIILTDKYNYIKKNYYNYREKVYKYE